MAGIRGSGVLPKGQQSWNIFVTKEARVDPKAVLESSMECLLGFLFFCPKINNLNKQTYFKMILKPLLLVTNQAEPFTGLLTAVHSFV